MTSALHDPTHLNDPTQSLRALLEQQLQTHTEQVTELTAYSRQPDQGGHDPDTLRGLIDTARQGIADTTQALRRVSEGSYGRCDHCGDDIPTARLEILPWVRFCVTCQERRRG